MRSKIILGGLATLILVLQVVPVERTNPPVQEQLAAPDSVMAIFRGSCFDCHSNETQWPWYAYVAPVSWFVTGHVNHARGHLNFSTWDAYDAEERADLIEEIWENVEKGEMPLPSYLRLHRDAQLSNQQLATLEAWTTMARRAMSGESTPLPDETP
jgi:hypothetical protein